MANQGPITENDLKLAREYFKIIELNSSKIEDFSKTLSSSTKIVAQAVLTAKTSYEQTKASLAQARLAVLNNEETINNLRVMSTRSAEEEKALNDAYRERAKLLLNEIIAKREVTAALTKYLKGMEAQYKLREKELTYHEKVKSTLQSLIKLQDDLKSAETLKKLGMIDDAQYQSITNSALKEANLNSFNLGPLNNIIGPIGDISKTVSTFTTFAKGPLEAVSKFGGAAINLLSKISDATYSLNKSMVEGVIDIYSSMGRVESRLYGSDKSFMSLVESINKTVGVNNIVTLKEVISSLEELVDNGVVYNLELRSLLTSMQENLVSTFNTMDETLTRLIRLLQQDNTQAYMGSESLLTKFFNENFNDTSYLSDEYDAVYSAIIDAMSTMDTDQASQFNYNVQKWLGALYSVGLSSSTISMLASAINDIATGTLDSDSLTLLALASLRSGTSYASYLTTGLNGDSVNKLLQSIVEYLQSIASNTDSNVLKKEFANLFGISVSDWTAISNLSSTDIGTIANSTINLALATQETEKLLNETVITRLHSSTKIDNLINNLKFAYGSGIANDETAYMEYVGSDLALKIGDSMGSLFEKIINVSENANLQRLLTIGLSSLSEALGDADLGSSVLNLFTGSTDVGSGIANVASAVLEGASNSLTGTFVGFDNITWSGIGNILAQGIAPYLSANLLSSFGMETSMRTSKTSASNSESGLDEETSTSYSISLASTTGLSEDIEELTETIQNSTLEQEDISLQREAEKVSATRSNIVSGEDLISRSLDDVYAALFENLNNPLRVGIAFYDDLAVSLLTLIFQSSDYFSDLSMMRA